LTNGFDDRIIANAENKTFLPATKENEDRFEESFNGVPLLTAKTAIRQKDWGELGVSYMGGVYNKFREDGLTFDKRRRLHVVAIDFNTTIPMTKTWVNTEWSFIRVDIPDTYSQQFGSKQFGGFVDFVQPLIQKQILGFEKSVVNAAMRVEYVDWNSEKFNETGTSIGDDIFSLLPGISWRPTIQTVLRLNYRYSWQRDIFKNPASKTAGFQFGFSSYF
jgi:hypothetical protein